METNFGCNKMSDSMWHLIASEFYLERQKRQALEMRSFNSQMFKTLQSRFPRSAKIIREFFDHRRQKIFEKRCKKIGYREHAIEQFILNFGKHPNLNNPSTFNEKLTVIKLHAQTKLYQQCTDKFAVREYVQKAVSNKILIPLHYVTNEINEINKNNIKYNEFVVKTNHDCGSRSICTDRDSFDWSFARNRLKRSLSRDYSFFLSETQYKGLPRVILVEEYIPLDEAHEFKIFCFMGTPMLIMSQSNRKEELFFNFYDRSWQPVYILADGPWSLTPREPPPMLSEMLEIATCLSRPFSFARIDLYSIKNSIYFSEITLTPFAALFRFRPTYWDEQLGNMLDIAFSNKT